MTEPVQTRTDLLAPFGYGFAYRSRVIPPRPAAGAEFEHEIGATVTRPASVIVTLATSADVADRYLTVQYRQDGTAYAISGAAVVASANTTARFIFSRAYAQPWWTDDTDDVYVPLDPSFLDPGHTLTIAVANIQAADQLSGIVLQLEHFPQPEGYELGEVEALPEPLTIPRDLDALARENDLLTLPSRLRRAGNGA